MTTCPVKYVEYLADPLDPMHRVPKAEAERRAAQLEQHLAETGSELRRVRFDRHKNVRLA